MKHCYSEEDNSSEKNLGAFYEQHHVTLSARLSNNVDSLLVLV